METIRKILEEMKSELFRVEKEMNETHEEHHEYGAISGAYYVLKSYSEKLEKVLNSENE